MALKFLFVDFNSYFASVEQELHPELRNRPVAIVPVMAESTCCIAASSEAKRFGVKTGTRVSDARSLCPDLQVLEAQPRKYVEYHHQLVETVESCMHVSKVCSIDEMACELSGRFQKRDLAEKLARDIKKKIAREVGTCLKSSIGIAPNRFLAKTASDMQKPDGLTILEEQDLPDRLYGLELRDLCGVGSQMDVRLRRAGIRTVQMLCEASRQKLNKVWGGVEGERMYEKLRGVDLPEEETDRSSVGHSHVLPPELRRDEAALAVLHRLLQKAAMRLRRMGYYAGTLTVSMKYGPGLYWSEEARFLETQDTLEFIRVFQQMWDAKPRTTRKPIKVSVTLSRLLSVMNYTASLFEERLSRQALNQAMDTLNERFGRNTIYFAGSHVARTSAPMRISFTNIPDPQTEGDERKDGFQRPPENFPSPSEESWDGI